MGLFRKLSLKNIGKGIGKVFKKPGKAIGDLFKGGKKPGGTKAGNFIRSVASQATGGILGQGANLKPKDPSTMTEKEKIQNAQISQSGNVVGQYLADKLSPVIKDTAEKIANNEDVKNVVDDLTDAGIKLGQDSLKRKLKDWFSKNWYFVLIPFGIILYLIFGRKKTPRRYSRNY